MFVSSLRRHSFALALAIAACGTMAACNTTQTGTAATTGTATALEGWSEASHGKDAKEDYAVAFPTDKVSPFQITIAPADWQAMLDNMTKLYGARGAGGMGGPGRMGSPMPRPSGSPFVRPSGAPGAMPPGGGGMGGPGGLDANTEKPMWVPATITFNGRTWAKVGVRFKGNSSLRSAWQSGTDNLPFKIDFDEFEDQFPEIKDQRFYGFSQLSLGTNWNDAALMRDALAYDILQDAGLAAAETGFYEVLLDRGEGPRRLGIYTSVEVIDDTVVKRAFGKDKGNIYEAEGPAATLAAGVKDRLSSSFQKENNKDSDWSDLEKLHDVLHAPERTSDPAAWRKNLEAVFDVDVYLRWLGIAAALGHWDTYGGMSHNYYLYNHHETNRLTWISWDHNLILGSMGGGPGGEMPAGGMAPPGFVVPSGAPMPFPVPSGAAPAGPGGNRGGGMGGRSTSFDRKDAGANWPLIRFLLDDPTYYATYVKHLRETAAGPFQAEAVQAKIQRYASVLAPAAGTPTYPSSVQSLSQAAQTQAKALADFLATQTP
ncbi:MAG: CotH kinase family protein [Candidatus Sericytochromatia bacterium]